MNIDERDQKLERWDKVIENSAEKNRNFFIAYLGLLIYVLAIVFSTTDLQLLGEREGLKLPFVDVTVPLLGFYWVAPLFVFALHLNFLQNLASHHYKLMRWRDAHFERKIPRERSQPFLFDCAILEDSGQFRFMVNVATQLLCYDLAPITMAVMLWRFTDRQDLAATSWHFVWFCADFCLLWKLYLDLANNAQGGSAAGFALPYPSRLSKCLEFFKYSPVSPVAVFVLFQTVLTFLVAATPDEYFVRFIQPLATVLARDSANDLWLPRIAIKPNESVWKPDVHELDSGARLAGYSDFVKYFNEKGVGFRPAAPSLRMISMPEQNLPRAQLLNIALQGADFSGASMQRANLRFARLQGANLEGAHMEGANLTFAQMQGVRLVRADIRNGNLQDAKLQGARLFDAQMQGADLRYAQMQGAEMGGVQMQGASLARAQMQGADLRYAQMQGADLRYAQMQGANLADGQMQGAIFAQTAVYGASGISGAAVFGFLGENELLSTTRVDWSSIEKIAKSIPNIRELDSDVNAYYYTGQKIFRELIERAKNRLPENADKQIRHNPAAIADATLPSVCEPSKAEDIILDSVDNRMANAVAFRRSYYRLYNRAPKDPPEFQHKAAFRVLLRDIDRTLCNLDACADVRGGIEGLACKQLAHAKEQKPARSKRSATP